VERNIVKSANKAVLVNDLPHFIFHHKVETTGFQLRQINTQQTKQPLSYKNLVKSGNGNDMLGL